MSTFCCCHCSVGDIFLYVVMSVFCLPPVCTVTSRTVPVTRRVSVLRVSPQKHLTRPGEPAVSDAAWSLISGLLTDNNRRLGHAEVLQHTFFTAVDWNNIANSTADWGATGRGRAAGREWGRVRERAVCGQESHDRCVFGRV